ncbi:hypothetical protein [Marivirga sp.]|uniref:hypothetical protein n=1 Tax=Marivirga sp. TaxID=2018662 RepID=UPI003DA7280C
MYRYILFFTVFIIYSCSSKRNEEIKSDQVIVEQLQNLTMKKVQKEAIADSLYIEKDFARVIDEYTTLIKNDSTKGVYFYRRGYSYGQFFKFDLAIADFKKSIDCGYREHDAYYSIAVIYHEVFEEDSIALDYLDKALLEDSTSKLAKQLVLKIETGDVKNI